ncbi:MAG: NAD-glutamate dehydrogenase [Myxococcota bacterium]
MPTVVDPKKLVGELSESFERTARDVVPWFIAEMPPAYFMDTDLATQLSHLRAIIAARASKLPLRMSLMSDDGLGTTFINERDYPGLLAQLVTDLPADKPLRQAKVHGTPGGHLVLNTLVLGEAPKYDPASKELSDKVSAILEHAEKEGLGREKEALRTHLVTSSADYLRAVTPERALRTYRRFRAVSGTDDTLVDLEQEADGQHSRILVMYGNANPRRVFQRVSARLGAHGIDIRRAHLDVFDDGKNGFVTLLTYVVQGTQKAAISPDSAEWKETRADLMRTKWLSDLALELERDHRGLGLMRAEIVTALLSLTHQILIRENSFAFAKDRVLSLAKKAPRFVGAVAQLFLERFRPEAPLEDAPFAARAKEAKEEAERSLETEDLRRIALTMLAVVEGTLRTNLHLDGRYALALRIDPRLMPRPEGGETPFGVFFVHGRGFDGFHVRFRDIARGGVRVVRPSSPEQLVLEADRLYEEVYGLAQAQQLKNKDIPEGGGKAVIVASAEVTTFRAVKGFTDGILDLITPDPKVRARIVDRSGIEEVLYLGPDENIIPEHIDWIVARAEQRGYPMARAFMSSKPGAGINHKEYGVTSEGVTVFLEVALKAVGIDPRKREFSLKITGGPDGDVAGNEIKILAREYGKNAKILGIADGSGSAEDPDGLDHPELLRLVAASLPIADFDPKKLSARGKVTPLSDPDGVRRRNTLHNRLVADAFIPAGGRPKTIHLGNWVEYLTPDGRPSSKIIVEGANLFITPEARQKLGEKGVLVIKDSSANKCGVICSSFEIGASMLLTTEEFLAQKPRFVSEVLTKLRQLAAREAETLFREKKKNPSASLPELSVRLSKVMNRAADAISARLDHLGDQERAHTAAVVERHLPASLVEKAKDRLPTRLPAAYARAIVASSLAADMVYREGIGWLDGLEPEAIADLALRYLAETETARRLAASVRASSLSDRETLALIVERAGVRALLE